MLFHYALLFFLAGVIVAGCNEAMRYARHEMNAAAFGALTRVIMAVVLMVHYWSIKV